jgi:hypothetical protein
MTLTTLSLPPPLAALIAVMVGAFAGKSALNFMPVFSTPLQWWNRRLVLDSASEVVKVYLIVDFLAVFGLGSFFLPTFSQDTPVDVVANMALIIVGIMRTIELWSPNQKHSKPLMLGISAGFGTGTYMFLTNSSIYFEKLKRSADPVLFLLVFFVVLILPDVLQLVSTWRTPLPPAPEADTVGPPSPRPASSAECVRAVETV